MYETEKNNGLRLYSSKSFIQCTNKSPIFAYYQIVPKSIILRFYLLAKIYKYNTYCLKDTRRLAAHLLSYCLARYWLIKSDVISKPDRLEDFHEQGHVLFQ